jgi:hypothetical protein
VGNDVVDRPAPPVAKKRGFESAGDMLRSLGVVMILVVMMWFLAQPPDSDEQSIRVVDPAPDVAAFTADVPAAPVPTGLPQGWRPTSSTLTGQPTGLRIGYVTPEGEYAEYAASTAAAEDFLPQITGEQAEQLAPVRVAGQSWDRYRDADGSLSLVRTYGPTTVVVGTMRASAEPAEIEALASSLSAS